LKTRKFGKSGPEVSEVGLGTWQFGGDWGEVTEPQAFETMKAAVDSGVDFFDTADVYGAGRSEALIGKFLKETKAKVFVATKIIRFPEPGGTANFTWESFAKHTEGSLGRLGVDSLDLTQLHCPPTSELQKGDMFVWLRKLKAQGKIKRFGVSVESMDQALLCLQQEGVESLQIIFNLFRQKPIDVLFDKAKEKGVALIIRLPLASGLLAGKYKRDTQFAPQDHRTYNRDGQAFNVGETFAGIPFEKGVELADQIKTMVPKGMTLAQMANRWCLDFDAVTTLIPGGKNAAQVIENAKASALSPLSEKMHLDMRGFYNALVKRHIRGVY